MSRREKAFREAVRQLYQDDATVYYTSSMPHEIGAASYWRAHGWKIADPAFTVGRQVIYALCLIAPVYASDNLIEVSGPAAAARRDRFQRFHAASEAEQQDWLWNEYLEQQFDVGDLDGRGAFGAGMMGAFGGEHLPSIAERRAAFGRDIWTVYQNAQRGKLFSFWRIPKTMSEALDTRFGREVYERFGFLPPVLEKKPDAAEESP